MSDAPTDSAQAEPTEEPANPRNIRGQGPVPLAFDGVAVDRTSSVNGSFGVQEARRPVAENLGLGGGVHRYDLTDRMVFGQPSEVTIFLRDPPEEGSIDVYLSVPTDQTWSIRAQGPADPPSARTYRLMLVEGEVHLNVEYKDPEPTHVVEYEVVVRVVADPLSVPPASGARVVLEAGDVLNVGSLQPPTASAALFVWAPDGRLAESYDLGEGIARVEADDWGPGAYAFAAAEAAGPLRVAIEAMPSARPPPILQMATSDTLLYGPFDGTTSAVGTFDAEAMPLIVRAILLADPGTPGDATMTIAPPGGETITVTTRYDTVGPQRLAWASGWMAETLRQGEWTVRADVPDHRGPEPIQLWLLATYMSAATGTE